MPSGLVTRDDIEDFAWRHFGVRDALKMKDFLKLVDAYVLTIAHKYVKEGSFEAHGYLAAGESDLTLGVTRCLQCGKIKSTRTQFHADRNAKTGRRNICKRCAGPLTQSAHGDPEQVLKCQGCGFEGKAEGNFRRRVDTLTGYGKRCVRCLRAV